MNNRFTVPIAVAVAVHATLLFGFSKSPRANSPVIVKPERDRRCEVFIIHEDKEVIACDLGPAIAKGAPNVSRSDIEDKITTATVRDFTVDVAPPNPVLTHAKIDIDSGPIGDPRGDKDSFRIEGVPVMSSMILDNPPNARVRVSPDYPFGPRNEGLEGEVMVEFVVDERAWS